MKIVSTHKFSLNSCRREMFYAYSAIKTIERFLCGVDGDTFYMTIYGDGGEKSTYNDYTTNLNLNVHKFRWEIVRCDQYKTLADDEEVVYTFVEHKKNPVPNDNYSQAYTYEQRIDLMYMLVYIKDNVADNDNVVASIENI